MPACPLTALHLTEEGVSLTLPNSKKTWRFLHMIKQNRCAFLLLSYRILTDEGHNLLTSLALSDARE